jgi:protein SCO1/2
MRKFERRRVLAHAIAAAMALQLSAIGAAIAAYDADPDRVQMLAEPRPIARFELTDQDARPFVSSDLRGRTSLVFFGFTNCQSVCPPTMTQLGQVARALEGEPGRFTNILISVDGKRDTPEAMARFLKQFSPTIIGLTGDPETVERVATDFKAVFFKGMPTDTPGGYDVEHTPQVYLVDRAGRLRATFYSASVDAMADATRAVMRER